MRITLAVDDPPVLDLLLHVSKNGKKILVDSNPCCFSDMCIVLLRVHAFINNVEKTDLKSYESFSVDN